MNPGYDHDRHHRRSIRLQGYDYSSKGAYFVTICTHLRAFLFGEIVDGEMILNDAGRNVLQCWNDIAKHFPHVDLDEFVVMPNHVHGIVVIDYVGQPHDAVGVGAKNFSPLPFQQRSGTSKTIGSIVRGFKIGVTKWMRQNTPIFAVWQRNYYEHIVRDAAALQSIRQYIMENPTRWAEDAENPDTIGRRT